jgi:plastocyanin
MSYRHTLPALALGFLLAVSASAQHNHAMSKDYDGGGGNPGGGDPNTSPGCSGVAATITISGTSFTPSTVTVQAGQPVCWTWSAPMSHNVYADDSSFTSGAPASTGTFQRTFTTPGTFGYYCQVHGGLGGGMRGTVIVTAPTGGGDGGGSGPGTLGFSPTSLTVNEADGVASVTVARTGGSDGKATVKFATAPASAKAGKDFTPRTGLLSWAAGDGDPKMIEIPIKKDNVPEPDKSFAVRLSKATGAALGAAVETVTIHDSAPGCGAAVAGDPAKLHAVGTVEGSTAACDERSALCLGDGRFEATVQWHPSIAGGAGGDRQSKRALLAETLSSGVFTSSSQEEPQLLLTVLDRCAVNGHYWLSLAAATDIEFSVKVRDTLTGRTRLYLNPAGSAPSVLRDVEAFGACQ